MTDQVDTKQVQWQDLEVAPEQEELTPVITGPTWEMGIITFHDIDEVAFAEAMERVLRKQEEFGRLSFLRGNWEEYSRAQCTPDRDPLTGHGIE